MIAVIGTSSDQPTTLSVGGLIEGAACNLSGNSSGAAITTTSVVAWRPIDDHDRNGLSSDRLH